MSSDAVTLLAMMFMLVNLATFHKDSKITVRHNLVNPARPTMPLLSTNILVVTVVTLCWMLPMQLSLTDQRVEPVDASSRLAS